MRSFVRTVGLAVVPIAALASGQTTPAMPVAPRMAELIGQLKDPDWDTRMEAATALGVMGPAAKVAIPNLVEALRDPVAPVRMKAIDALMFMGATAAAAAPEIASALSDPDELVRVSAVVALPRVTPDRGSTVPLLKRALADKGWKVRRAAAVELVQLKAELPSAVPVLREGLKDATSSERLDAIATLGPVVSPEERHALAALAAQDLKHADTEVRKEAVRALGRLGPDAVPYLVGVLEAEPGPPQIRLAAMHALARLGPEAKPALPVLQRLAQRKGVWLKPAQRTIAAIEGRREAPPEDLAGPIPPVMPDAPVAGPASPAANPSPAPSASPHR